MRTIFRMRFAGPLFCLGFGAILTVSAAAQTAAFHGSGISPRGVPASVTSFGFGGHPGFHGNPASVTSQGFGSAASFRGVGDRPNGFGSRNGFHGHPFKSGRRMRRRFAAGYGPFYGGYYNYAPYAYPYYLDDDNDDSGSANQSQVNDAWNYSADDDRRLLDEDYRAALNGQRDRAAARTSEPVADQPSTLLIFKDGHQQEISNYAIVGSTLYELSDGRSIKVQLADLDLSATARENDSRGVEFQIPAQIN